MEREERFQELEEIREGIVEILLELHPDMEVESLALVDERILDSFDIITLVTQIREEFDVVVPAERILPQYFNSANALSEMILELMEEE
ncbi:MAG: acyl carrier protein [Lachnospiraceae bacterium]|nr:acyl carrier protein [Lachnospiraceae bacterium]